MRRWQLFFLALTLQSLASAAAWTSAKGHGQVILTSSWFQTSKGYDQNGGMPDRP